MEYVDGGNCDEITLDLLEHDEAIDLLLRTGRVPNTDKESVAAAGEIADLTGCLPLFLSIKSFDCVSEASEPLFKISVSSISKFLENKKVTQKEPKGKLYSNAR